MHIIIFGTPILIGFIMGYFFNTTMTIIISVVAAIFAIALRPKPEQEIGGLIGVIVWIVLGTGFVIMWSTHLYVSDTSLNIPNLGKYIFRQQ